MTVRRLDARRLLCPMPVIKTQDEMNALNPGDQLHIVFTDPGALHDIPTWSRINGHRIIEVIEGDDESVIVLEVGPDPRLVELGTPAQ